MKAPTKLIINPSYSYRYKSVHPSGSAMRINKNKNESNDMTLKYLITGATGGLGKEVLAYFIANRPSSEYAAASSRESNRAQFEERGIAFRRVDYDDPRTLDAAFTGVENLFFVSTNVFDNERRIRQHRNFVDAAKRAGVKHVCSLS